MSGALNQIQRAHSELNFISSFLRFPFDVSFSEGFGGMPLAPLATTVAGFVIKAGSQYIKGSERKKLLLFSWYDFSFMELAATPLPFTIAFYTVACSDVAKFNQYVAASFDIRSLSAAEELIAFFQTFPEKVFSWQKLVCVCHTIIKGYLLTYLLTYLLLWHGLQPGLRLSSAQNLVAHLVVVMEYRQ